MRIHAWFCAKCHNYHEVKEIPITVPENVKVWKSTETCTECGFTQQVEIIKDYWGKDGLEICKGCGGKRLMKNIDKKGLCRKCR